MKTDDLISRLSKQAVTVRRLPSLTYRFFVLSSVSAVLFLITLRYFGPRPDITQVFRQIPFQLETLVLIFLFAWGARAALLISVPGTRPSSRQLNVTWGMLLVGVLALFLAGLPQWSLPNFSSTLQSSEHCINYISFVGVILGLFFLWYLRRAAPLYPLQTGGLALLSSGSLSALTVHFLCKSETPLHLLLGHYLPLTVVSFTGLVLGNLFLASSRKLAALTN